MAKRGGADSPERILEQTNSFKLLGDNAHNIFLHFPDTQLLIYAHELIDTIGRQVQPDIPDIVYIPSALDYHQDHVVTNHCALAVFNNLRVHKILTYETPSTMPKFSPNYFKFFTRDRLATKLEALGCHRSQQYKPYFSKEAVYALGKMRAAQGRFYDGVAEAFEIIWQAEFAEGYDA